MPGYVDIPKAIETAERLLKQRSDIMSQIDTVRSDLRNAIKRKETTNEQKNWIEGQFPLVKRTRREKKPQTAQ